MQSILLNLIVIAVTAFRLTSAIPDAQCTSKLEVFSECGAHCQPTCDDPKGANPCQDICVPGCVCRSGLVRNAKGQCIRASKCIKCPDPNAVYSLTPCQNTCTQPDLEGVCQPLIPEARCICKEGFVKNREGICITLEELASINTQCPGKFEVFTECGAACQPRCDEPNGWIPCPPFCAPGCICSPGYVKNSTGDCIPASECTPTSEICPGANEMISRCEAGVCQNTCEKPFYQTVCEEYGCIFGCVCQNGTLRDCNGNCVSAEDCAVCEDPNAHYSNTDAHGCQNTCVNPTLAMICRPAGPQRGCVCNDGFLKDANGLCQLAQCCVTCPDPNAVYSLTLATACQDTCEQPDLESVCRPLAPEAGCICRDGFVKNSEGMCVTIEQCNDPRCPRPTEVFSQCDAQCQRTCADPEGMDGCPKNCIPGCVCASGLYRTTAGDCVPLSECTCDTKTCTEPNQEVDQCGANGCQNTCAQPFLNTFCDPFGCSYGCLCMQGFLRDPAGNCVFAEDCVVCEDPNAHFSNSNATACQNTCAQPDLSTYCTPIEFDRGCVCNDGFLLDVNGVCQPAECCAICDDPNAHFSLTLATPCQNTCEEQNFEDNCEALAKQAGCICNDGYVKNSKGLCVVLNDCCTLTCGINEHLDECASTCPPETCDIIGKQFKCPEQPPADCQPECRCNANYLRDGRGICVMIQQCPPLECFELFEVYDPCPLCTSNICTEPPICQSPTEVTCQPQCLCLEGYSKQFVANEFVCVPRDECQVCSRDNEIFIENGPSCEPTCSTLYSDEVCIAQVQSGCFCAEGFIRDTFKNCIPVNRCYLDICLENEVRSCGSACDTTCATLGIPCPIINIVCNNMCYCNEGFARDDCGKCIPIDQCPMNNGCGADMNAVEDRCPNQCPQTCEDCVGNLPISPCNECGTRPGCDCLSGYILDETTGFCVKPEFCHRCTGANEFWSGNIDCTCDDLVSGCSPNATSTTDTAVEGCRCIDGYVRDEFGNCIPAGTCPRCPELEEFRSCGTACPVTCANINDPPGICITLCVSACFCKEGLFRNAAGKCVEADECPVPPAPVGGCNGDPNSSNVTCPTPCPLTCANFQTPPIFCSKLCVQFGCQCNEGLVLNQVTGLCVSPRTCPVGCGNDPNAVEMLFPPTCVRTCDNYQNPNFFCDESTEELICVCQSGFVFDALSGLCITPEKCPAGCNGDLNAVHSACGNICPRTCELQGPRPCPQICLAGGGCVCLPGFVQGGPFSRCIIPEQCPFCGDNAVYSCGSACQNTCNTLGDICQIINVRCNDDCFCNPGFARDAYGNCIPEKKCPPKVGCRGDANAHIESCPGALCSVTCENYAGSTKPFQCDEFCRSDGKCVCNAGKIRDETTDYCVDPNDCYRCSGDNEAFYFGIDLTCDEVGAKGIIEKLLAKKKRYLGCHCKADFIRNDAGICIPSHRCPRCSPTEQYTECGTACPKTCANRFLEILCIDQCITGCYCKKPTIRNDFGVCVSPKQCPPQGCDGDYNAVMGSYIPGCVPTCDNPLAAQDCPLTIQDRVKGCVCNAGRVLDTLTGLCVMEHECPPGCGGDPNAVFFECQDICPVTCGNMNIHVECLICIRPGECRCKPGYVKSDSGRCIPPQMCLKCPDPNAVFSLTPCQDTCEQSVLERCICKDGYVKNKKGICVTLEEIASINTQCSSELEVFSECGAVCQPRCDEPIGWNLCPDICGPGCVCSPGFLKNTTGDCIPASECTPTSERCPGANEMISRCEADVCQNTCEKPFFITVCISYGCTFGCVCQNGFLRDCNGNCVWAEDCVVCEDPNAHFSNTEAHGCQNTCANPTFAMVCRPAGPERGCICNDGFLKDANGLCQQAQCCVTCPDPNAVYSLTLATPCQNTCEQPDLESVCRPLAPEAGCICRDGFVKNSEGMCVTIEQCNDPRCPRPTEVFSQCDAQCQRTCAEPEGMDECPKNCIPGCVCASGLYRTTAGDCVPLSECTCDTQTCTEPNQVVDQCGANGCQNTCEQPFLNTFCDPFGCSYGCICMPGFLRDPSGDCVFAEDCVVCEDPNAHFSNTNANACQNTCAQPDLSTYCTPIEFDRGCVCNDGYLLDSNGVCQPAESCAICDDPNAHFSLTLATPCQNTCEDPTLEDHCAALVAQAGCICNDGFVKNSKGLCVVLGDCCTLTCGINEHLEECASTCPPETCDSIGKQFKCPIQPPPDCQPECKCNVNHLRDGRGICVPIQQCPPLECFELFEVYDPCPLCISNICTEPPICVLPTDVICQPQCLCIEGYSKQFVANEFVCVPRDECQVCSRDNEVFIENGPSCEPTCITLYSDEVCIAQVQSGCFCAEGFIRDTFKNCIPVNRCYLDICLENEVRSCGSACDTTCATLGIPCPIINIACNNMCYCNQGFARDDCGKCIPIEQCPMNNGCGADTNAVEDRCPNQCPQTCEDCVGNPLISPCNECGTRPGCDCLSGYILDETTGFCVRPEFCHLCTGANEFWSTNVDCTCDDLASGCSPNATSTTDTAEEGCRCIDGYVRDALDNCIPAGTCPRCPVLEEFLTCGTACPITCANINKPPLLCIDLCVEACFCKEGLFRNAAGKCVAADECRFSATSTLKYYNYETTTPIIKRTTAQ